MKISVILCTYNGASRLPATLEKLAAQTLPAECLWEVVLIDNASTDDTPVVARQIATNFPVPLRVLHEPQPGKANALHTAFREAAGEYYCVVDDDNLLESEYLTQGILFLDQHSDVALIGGRTFPAFPVGVTPPADFDRRYSQLLACNDRGSEVIWNSIPPGAGQMGRVALMRGIYEHIGTWLSDRVGDGFGCCEDLEKAFVCRQLGWRSAHVPQLRLHHLMSPRRLTGDYIDALQCAALATIPWLLTLEGKEAGTSWLRSALRILSDIFQVGKYTLLSAVPQFHRRLKRAPFCRKMYGSRLAARFALLKSRQRAIAYVARIHAAPICMRPQSHGATKPHQSTMAFV